MLQAAATLVKLPECVGRNNSTLFHFIVYFNFFCSTGRALQVACCKHCYAISVAFVRPSVPVSVCLSVCLSVAYIANNSRSQRPCMPRFVMKVSHFRCDSHTSFKVKRSKVKVTDGRGHTVSAEPGGQTACFIGSKPSTEPSHA